MRSSSVLRSARFCVAAELFIVLVLLPVLVDCISDRWEFFAFIGILPETYLAAPPFPGFKAGNLFAMTVVDRGTMAVSSSYSISLLRYYTQ